MYKHYGIKCPNCKERLFSMHGRDFHGCECGDTFVDGVGKNSRIGAKDPSKVTRIILNEADHDAQQDRMIEWFGKTAKKFSFKRFIELAENDMLYKGFG